MVHLVLIVDLPPARTPTLARVLADAGLRVVSAIARAGSPPAALDLSPSLLVLCSNAEGDEMERYVVNLRDRGYAGPILAIVPGLQPETASRLAMLRVMSMDPGAGIRSVVASARELVGRELPRAAHPGEPVATEYRTGELVVRPGLRLVQYRGQDVELNTREFDVLLALLRSEGAVVSRARLLGEAWGVSPRKGARAVDGAVSALRRKLADAGADPGLIRTVWKVGYRMDHVARRDLPRELRSAS